jgi:nucleotide-binding universal stress UspA family protein
MNTLQRILIGYNLLPEGEVALRAARLLATRANAALSVLHVVEPFPSYKYKLFLSNRLPVEEIAAKLRPRLQALVEGPEFSGVTVETDVRIGKPFVELIEVAREWPADLVVVGISPPGEERFLGSTAERILRKTPASVLIAKQEWPLTLKTILVPTDFSEGAKQAAEQAVALAELYGSQVVFLHVLDLSTPLAAPYDLPTAWQVLPTAEELEPEWQNFLSEVSLPSNVSWEKVTVEGRAAATIAAVANERQADVIVMGTHGRSGLTRMLLGSVAEKVTRITSCSVLTVRPQAFRLQFP